MAFIEVYFTYYTIHPFPVGNSVGFSIFRVVQPYHYLISEHFHHLRKKHCTHWQSLPTLFSTNLLSASINLRVMHISNKWMYNTWASMTGFCRLARCSQGSSMVMCQHFNPFHCWIVFHLRDITYFCLSIHHLMGIWNVSTLGWLWIFPCKFSCGITHCLLHGWK